MLVLTLGTVPYTYSSLSFHTSSSSKCSKLTSSVSLSATSPESKQSSTNTGLNVNKLQPFAQALNKSKNSSLSSFDSSHPSKSNCPQRGRSARHADSRDGWSCLCTLTIHPDGEDEEHHSSSCHRLSSKHDYSITRFVFGENHFGGLLSPASTDKYTSTENIIQTHTASMKLYLDNFDAIFYRE